MSQGTCCYYSLVAHFNKLMISATTMTTDAIIIIADSTIPSCYCSTRICPVNFPLLSQNSGQPSINK